MSVTGIPAGHIVNNTGKIRIQILNSVPFTKLIEQSKHPMQQIVEGRL